MGGYPLFIFSTFESRKPSTRFVCISAWLIVLFANTRAFVPALPSFERFWSDVCEHAIRTCVRSFVQISLFCYRIGLRTRHFFVDEIVVGIDFVYFVFQFIRWRASATTNLWMKIKPWNREEEMLCKYRFTLANHGTFRCMHCICNKPNGRSIDTCAMLAEWVRDHVVAVASIGLNGFVRCRQHRHRQTPSHLPIVTTPSTTMTHSMMQLISRRILNHCHWFVSSRFCRSLVAWEATVCNWMLCETCVVKLLAAIQ